MCSFLTLASAGLYCSNEAINKIKGRGSMNANVLGQGPFEGIQDAVEQAVVQVFSQIVRFNWLEPYAASEQFEQRGSGFFIDARGYIITNAHVVSEAKAIWIQMPAFGQKSFFVELVGFCPERDLALLKLNEEDRSFIESIIGGIPYLPLGDSDILRRTDPIVVLGYPLGQMRVKSSTGVVAGWESGAGRSWIQLTAPINPGNSGGPLINIYGQAIGIAVLTVVPAQNVGYAIPINELKMILEDLYSSGLIRRANLGIAFNFGSETLAKSLGNPQPSGLYINKVFPRSLAAKAGIKSGDMLYTFNTLTVDAYGDVSATWSRDKASIHDLIARLHRGSPISMTIYRQGVKHEFSYTYELDDPYPVRTKFPDYESIEYEVVAGMVVMELAENHIELLLEVAPYLLKFTKLENKTEPVLVISHILPGSLSQLSRSLMPGNIIKEVNAQKTDTLESFRKALALSASTNMLTLKTEDDILVALPIADVLDDEIKLAEYFGYEMSEILKNMVK